MFKHAVFPVFTFFALALACCSQAATLVRDGRATAVIALPAEPDEQEALAAKDLVDYVSKMSGATLEVKKLDDAGLDALLTEAGRQGQTAVVLGRLAMPRLRQALGDSTQVRGAFALQIGAAGGNTLVAAAGDEWEFQLDQQRIGEDIGLWRPENWGGNWQTIKTSSSSWSNQGLRYYKGLAWYRQTVDVRKDAAGKRLFLWCGGVDETARVWVNGKPIGISSGSAFLPFEMDATGAVQAGKNTIVFCVSNQVVNELGTGGILAPVILYAPKDGANAKLENVRDLKPTFP